MKSLLVKTMMITFLAANIFVSYQINAVEESEKKYVEFLGVKLEIDGKVPLEEAMAKVLAQKSSRDEIRDAFVIAAENDDLKKAIILWLTKQVGEIQTAQGFVESLVVNLIIKIHDARKAIEKAQAAGANIDEEQEKEKTLLRQLEAVLSMLKKLKNAGYDISSALANKDSALINLPIKFFQDDSIDILLQSAKGDKDLLSLLLKSKNSITPLHAILNLQNIPHEGAREIVYSMIRSVLDFAEIDEGLVQYLLDTPNQGYTPLMDSIFLYPNGTLVKLLLKRGLEAGSKQLEIKDPQGETVLDFVNNEIDAAKGNTNPSREALLRYSEYQRIYKLINKAMNGRLPY